jgi:hypothetical protein
MFALGLGQYRPAFDRLVFADLAEDFLAVFLTVFFDVALAFADLDFDALEKAGFGGSGFGSCGFGRSGFPRAAFRSSGYCCRRFIDWPWKSPSNRLFGFFYSCFNSRLGEGSGGLSRKLGHLINDGLLPLWRRVVASVLLIHGRLLYRCFDHLRLRRQQHSPCRRSPFCAAI